MNVGLRAAGLGLVVSLALSPSGGDAAEPQVAPLVVRRSGALASRCQVEEKGTTLAIRCDFPVSAMTLLAGDAKGTLLRGASADAQGLPRDGTVSWPRAGGPRAALFWTLGPGYDGPLTVVPAVVAQAREDDGKRLLLLYDALHEPVRTARSLAAEKALAAVPAPPLQP